VIDVHVETGGGQITRLDRNAKRHPQEIERGPDRLTPEGDHCRRMVTSSSEGDKAVLVGEVARELGESVSLAVTVKRWTEDDAEYCKAERDGLAHPMLHPYIHQATRYQAI
jgi:hypothetical protein